MLKEYKHAFSPLLSYHVHLFQSHLHSYIHIKVQEVIILAVHDGAVMMNWAKSQKTALSMLTFLGDPHSALTRGLDLELTHPGPVDVLGPGRCKRFAMHVVDGEIRACNVSETEDDPTGENDHSNSLAEGIMATMK